MNLMIGLKFLKSHLKKTHSGLFLNLNVRLVGNTSCTRAPQPANPATNCVYKCEGYILSILFQCKLYGAPSEWLLWIIHKGSTRVKSNLIYCPLLEQVSWTDV